VLVDFFEDMMRIQRWYLDPNNSAEVMQVASSIVRQPPERFGWLFTAKDYFRDPNLKPDLVALQRNVDLTAEMGFIQSRFDVKQHSDLSLIEEAANRLR
jgi:NitT/TauT family transport system substrate-binding protein